MNHFLKITLVVVLVMSATSYNIDSKEGCNSNLFQQSPINIDSAEAKYYEEKYFRLISTNYTEIDGKWAYFSDEESIGFEGDFGSIILVKDWSMYKFNLKKIMFRIRSSHSVDNQFSTMEMELHHTLDEEYRTKGKYIHATSKVLILHIEYGVIDDEEKRTKITSKLFQDLNVVELSTTNSLPNISVPIKLKKIVQNNPAYFYEGATTSSNGCIKAWRMIMPSYQVIRQTELNYMIKAFERRNLLSSTSVSNSRNIQEIRYNTVIYRNVANEAELVRIEHPNQYDLSKFLRADLLISFLIVLMLN